MRYNSVRELQSLSSLLTVNPIFFNHHWPSNASNVIWKRGNSNSYLFLIFHWIIYICHTIFITSFLSSSKKSNYILFCLLHKKIFSLPICESLNWFSINFCRLLQVKISRSKYYFGFRDCFLTFSISTLNHSSLFCPQMNIDHNH